MIAVIERIPPRKKNYFGEAVGKIMEVTEKYMKQSTCKLFNPNIDKNTLYIGKLRNKLWKPECVLRVLTWVAEISILSRAGSVDNIY